MRSKLSLVIPPILVAMVSIPLCAQQRPKQSWDNLNRLQAGQKIQVVQMDIKSLKGKFLGFSEEAITLRVKKDEVTVPREDVLRVTRRDASKRRRNILLGLLIGGAAGAAAGVVPDIRMRNEGQTAIFTPILAAAGAGVGGALGAASGYRTIYRAKRRKPGKGL